jgi:hypothetical protein
MHPGRRWLVFLSAAIAVLAAVLAVVLPVVPASASAGPAAGTRVGASHPEMILAVGASRAVSAGEGRCGPASQAGFAVGACVAAEDGGSGIGEDLYHFGRSPNSDLEPIRGARPSDFGDTGGTETVGPYTPTGPLDEVGGASTYIDAGRSGLSGHYYSIPAGTQLPDGLGIQADGEDVCGTAPWGHRTIYPTVPMTFDQFQELFRSLPWSYMGNLK